MGTIKNGSCKVRYLYNSGFVVETAEHVLIFDLCELSEFVNDDLVSDRKVTFFVTHNHSDHFDPLIYQWDYKDGVQYVIHRDVATSKDANILLVEADEQYYLEGIAVQTFGTTDRGVFFLVEVNGLSLFHSGDLNWWKWKNDSVEIQNKEESAYKSEVQKLKNTPLDIAFIPVDPRLDDYHNLAVKYFADTVTVNTIIPMHFRDVVQPVEDLSMNWGKLGYSSKFVSLTKSGDSLNYKG